MGGAEVLSAGVEEQEGLSVEEFRHVSTRDDHRPQAVLGMRCAVVSVSREGRTEERRYRCQLDG